MYCLKRHIFIVFFAFFSSVFNAHALPLPEIIPHRGGRAEQPENTLPAFKKCLELGAKILEMDVQVTKDGIAVVYHPGDLSANTEGRGKIGDLLWSDIQNLDAAYKFEQKGSFPERGKRYRIPRLEDVLIAFSQIQIIVDLKSLPAESLIESIAKVADKAKAWDRLIFYSTDDSHLNYLKTHYPKAKLFESRRNTAEEILNSTGSQKLQTTQEPVWLGFELTRQFKISEKLALGDAEYPVNLVVWTDMGIKRVRDKLPNAKIVMFGINSVEDYKKASELGAFAVYTDTPSKLFDAMQNP
ncbi:MAG: hypothetical protein FJX71_02030 [Alphaproteobacteria bacterium]|nr:hypothetical protein [Alphaproteobacteria bacterium]